MNQGRSGGSSDPLPEKDRSRTWSTDVHVARWQAGDETAFRALHDRFAPLLQTRALRHPALSALNGRMQLPDVVQEIWKRAVPAARKAFTPSGPGSFLAFLGTLADRTITDLARVQFAEKRGRAGAERPFDTNAERQAARNPGRSAFETPTSRARVAEIEVIARATLHEREFEAWWLVDWQDYTAEEAGLALGTTSSAVRGLLLRGRARLVARLSEGFPD